MMEEILEGKDQANQSFEWIPIPELPGEVSEVIKDGVLPVLQRYIDTLETPEGRREITSRTRETGGLLQENHEANTDNLKALESFLEEFVKDPSQYKEGSKQRDLIGNRQYYQFLLEMVQPQKTPDQPQLKKYPYFWMGIGKPEVIQDDSRRLEETMRSVAYSRSAEEAAEIEDTLLDQTTREFILIIGMLQIQEDEKTNTLKEVFDSGIAIMILQKRCMVKGYIPSGWKSYYTDPINCFDPETKKLLVGLNECKILRGFLEGIFSSTKKEK